MLWFEKLLRRFVPHKEIGWEANQEKFTRYAFFKSRWFNVYLHQLHAPIWHLECHDHPWSFVTFLLANGYDEQIGMTITRRFPGEILYRPATHLHSVRTPYGTSWSFVITGPTIRKWGFRTCEE